jgi:ElaB/YqjD/DUF883 family membrane-anchored ribosome-binding protein
VAGSAFSPVDEIAKFMATVASMGDNLMSAQIKLFTGDTPPENNEPSMSAMSSTGSTTGTDEQAILDDLRAQYDKLRDEVTAVISERTEQAARLARDGADGLRSQIRSAPGTSIALAVLAGGLIGVLLTSRRELTWGETAQNSVRDTAHRYQAALRNVDINDLAERLRRSADSTLSSTRDQASGIIPGLERLAQSLSTMDSSSFTPAIEKGTSWLKSVWDKLPAAPTLNK